MSTELNTIDGRHVILMKNGITHLVSKETADRVAEHIVNQEAHSFIKLSELGVTINSADISGVYTPQQHEEMTRIAAGEYKCPYDVWHKKKQTCECAAEARKKREDEMRRIQWDSEHRPLTEEERARARDFMKRMREQGALDGSPLFRPRYHAGARNRCVMRRSAIREWEEKTGRAADLTDLLIDEEA